MYCLSFCCFFASELAKSFDLISWFVCFAVVKCNRCPPLFHTRRHAQTKPGSEEWHSATTTARKRLPGLTDQCQAGSEDGHCWHCWKRQLKSWYIYNHSILLDIVEAPCPKAIHINTFNCLPSRLTPFFGVPTSQNGGSKALEAQEASAQDMDVAGRDRALPRAPTNM